MIYLDNSATSYKKPREVIRAVKEGLNKYYSNPGRGGHKNADASSRALFDTRCAVAEFVNTTPEKIVFTYNATYALNTVIMGLLKNSKEIMTSRFEHNSVLRPLYLLEDNFGVKIRFLKSDPHSDRGIVKDFEKHLKAGDIPDAVILTHTTNVIGDKMPVFEIGRLCKKHNIMFIVDGSQGLGPEKIDMEKNNIDILCSSGHKGLYGIMGVGFIAFSKHFDADIYPLVSGGSGILSSSKYMPESLPERLEAGTLGLIPILSLKAGIEFINKVGVNEISQKEKYLKDMLTEGLMNIDNVKVYAPDSNSRSIVLANIVNMNSNEFSYLLSDKGIYTRSGLHCAPLSHKFLGTFDSCHAGAVRFSIGYFNSERQIKKTVYAVSQIAEER